MIEKITVALYLNYEEIAAVNYCQDDHDDELFSLDIYLRSGKEIEIHPDSIDKVIRWLDKKCQSEIERDFRSKAEDFNVMEALDANRLEWVSLKLEDFPPFRNSSNCQRIFNCLKAEEINTIGDLIQCTPRRLNSIPNLGKKTLFDIKMGLALFNLSLADTRKS